MLACRRSHLWFWCLRTRVKTVVDVLALVCKICGIQLWSGKNILGSDGQVLASQGSILWHASCTQKTLHLCACPGTPIFFVSERRKFLMLWRWKSPEWYFVQSAKYWYLCVFSLVIKLERSALQWWNEEILSTGFNPDCLCWHLDMIITRVVLCLLVPISKVNTFYWALRPPCLAIVYTDCY